MKKYTFPIFTLLLFLSTPFATKAQYFEAYLQENYKWSGSKFISDNSAVTSTKFQFDGSEWQIDNQYLTVVNRISNSNGDYFTAVSNKDKSLRISITVDTKADVKGRKFKCITVERPRVYKIVYYIK